MQTKLTLRMDDELIERAKTYARAHDTSVSELVASFLARLTREPQEGWEKDLHPSVQRLLGIARRPGEPAPTDEELDEERYRYLEAKHSQHLR